jgi:hypothetical protein
MLPDLVTSSEVVCCELRKTSTARRKAEIALKELIIVEWLLHVEKSSDRWLRAEDSLEMTEYVKITFD